MASNLKKVSEILHDMVEEFRKSNDEWERRYGSANVSRSSNDGVGTNNDKSIGNRTNGNSCEQSKGECK
jgi:hypothetical protein